jgi:hypothetical protein
MAWSFKYDINTDSESVNFQLPDNIIAHSRRNKKKDHVVAAS